MTGLLRIVLIVVSALTAFFLLRRIAKAQFVIEDTLYWIFFCVLLLMLGIFPRVSAYFSQLLGFESPSNFIFVLFIFLLLVKVFSLSVKLSKLETKLKNLIEQYAIDFQKDSEKNG